MMFYRLLKNQNVSGTASFRDMSGDEWYAEAVYTLSKLGIVQGYKDGTFHGNDSISRAAFTAIASRFLKASGQTLTTSVRRASELLRHSRPFRMVLLQHDGSLQ